MMRLLELLLIGVAAAAWGVLIASAVAALL